MNNLTEKINRKIDELLKLLFFGKKIYKYLFISYWHYLIYRKKKHKVLESKRNEEKLYITSGMNYGGGIAHQIHCWYSGVMLARDNNIGYAYPSFWINGGHSESDDFKVKCEIGKIKICGNSKVWDNVLGFGESEKTVEKLRQEGYKVRRLPYYRFSKEENVCEFRGIIDSYRGCKVILLPSVDQTTFYPSENEKSSLMRRKFWSSSSRKHDELYFQKDKKSIAVHIRRGDVSLTSYADRYLDFEYYKNAIDTAVADLNLSYEEVTLYIFSEGEPQDFEYFNIYPNVKLCLDWDSKKSFLHMVYADVIITGISGFSVSAAILSDGKRYVYKDYFTAYCDNMDWIILDNNGKRVVYG